MSELSIFVAVVCGATLLVNVVYHRLTTLRRLRWREDVYKLYALRDRFLWLKIQDGISDQSAGTICYDMINTGILAGKSVKWRELLSAMVGGYKRVHPKQAVLYSEMEKNGELAKIMIEYFVTLFEAIRRRSLAIKLVIVLVRVGLTGNSGVEAIKSLFRNRNLLVPQREAYNAYKWARDFPSAGAAAA